MTSWKSLVSIVVTSNHLIIIFDMEHFIGRPIAFACYKSSPHWNEGVVTYTRCNIPTEGMDKSTGNFHVKKAGVYRLSFTGLFNAQNGHRVTADIMRRNKNNVLDFLGRSAAETNEAGALFGEIYVHVSLWCL